MRKVLIVGGPLDGTSVDLAYGQRDICLRRTTYGPTPPTSDLPVEPVASDPGPTLHTERFVTTPEGRVSYLAPSSWTDYRALCHALRPR